MKRISWLTLVLMVISPILTACPSSTTCKEMLGQEVTGYETSVCVRYEGVDGNAHIAKVKTSVLRNSGECEFRLEYNSPINQPDWSATEVSSDQGDPQRHYDPDCRRPEFTETTATSARYYEEQTTYYWIMKARQYAINHLWVTPHGWTGEPPTHATNGVDIHVLKSGFGNACWPDPRTGCFRAWPIAGPRINLKAGAIEPELIVHEYGHYAAGYVFGHMDTLTLDASTNF